MKKDLKRLIIASVIGSLAIVTGCESKNSNMMNNKDKMMKNGKQDMQSSQDNMDSWGDNGSSYRNNGKKSTKSNQNMNQWN